MRTERRWIVLGQDGRHVTLGRAAPPTDAEIEAAAAALAAQGIAGWLATRDGAYWSRRRVVLASVQILAHCDGMDWPVAVAAFVSARKAATASR